MTDNSFEARLFLPDSAEAEVAIISLTAKGLLAAPQNITIEYHDLKLEVTGQEEDRVKITDTKGGSVLILKDKKFLEELQKAGGPKHLKEHAKKAHHAVSTRNSRHRNYWLTIVGIIITIIGLSYFSLEPLQNLLVSKIDPDVEKKIAKFLLDKKAVEKTSSPRMIRVHKIGKRLTAQLENCPYQFKFHVQKDKAVNAFAYPAGYIFVNSALIDQAKSDDEIAGVLGHEIGHVIHRDSLRATVRKLGLVTVVSLLVAPTAGSKGAEEIAGMLEVAEHLENLNYSRQQESAADMEGLKLTIKAGYAPEAVIGFFQRLEKEEPGAPLKILGLLSTHPMSSDRIARIREELKKYKGYKKYTLPKNEKAESSPPTSRSSSTTGNSASGSQSNKAESVKTKTPKSRQ